MQAQIVQLGQLGLWVFQGSTASTAIQHLDSIGVAINGELLLCLVAPAATGQDFVLLAPGKEWRIGSSGL